MTESTSTYIISDLPEETAVDFNFDAYAKTIADLIANKENKTPLVIGVYGPWGSGKTTLMQTIKSHLKDGSYSGGKGFRKCKTVWFQAWKYAQEDQILAALIEEIFRTMKRDNFFEQFKAEIEALVKRLNPFKVFGKAVKDLAGFDPTEFMGQLEYKQKLGFYDTFQEFFDRLIWTYTNIRPQLTANEAPDDTEGALVIFIDDLDRCPQERIVKVLETIKLFMDKKGCVFVLGADSQIIGTALEKNFGPEGALRFMDKIVQVTFRLPQISQDDFSGFIRKIAPKLQKNIIPHLPVILPAIRQNPRQLKRFLNNTRLQASLCANTGVEIEFDHLLFWNMLELVYPQLVRELNENPAVMDLLGSHAQKLLEEHNTSDRWELSPEMLKDVPEKSLHPYLKDKRLVDIVARVRITREDLTCLCTLSRMVTAEEDLKIKVADPVVVMDKDDMAEIPAGEFLYGENKEPRRIEMPFSIDIYPVTNRQFKGFIDAKGYEKDEFWSEKGVQWRNQEKISEPMFWNDEKWNPPDHPVVGVSWYEAEAFAKWAGKALPTEEQWERAARGTDGREYPWEGGFDKEKCNTKESGIGKTTRVTRYPNGISPAGCYDMVGNVWEWTINQVLRGGGWGALRFGARCALRRGGLPDERVSSIGFRCVRTE
jgi:iron(II)-dependent oxidoreductase